MIKNWIGQNFNIVLALGVLVGLIVPGLELLPKSTAMIFISAAIFFSCPFISITDIKNINVKQALSFYVVRFLLLPIPVYYIALWFIPDYALAVLLLVLMPVGASSTTVAAIMRANSSFTLSSTIITSALAPLMITAYVFFLVQQDIAINTTSMFISLSLGMFVPVLLYFGAVRRFEPVKNWVKTNSKPYATLCIAIQVAVVIALEKEFIIANIDKVIWIAGFGMIVYAMLYISAFIFGSTMSWKMQKTYMLCSGVNNNGLATGVAVLYFSSETIFFVVISEIPWLLALMVFKYYSDKKDLCA